MTILLLVFLTAWVQTNSGDAHIKAVFETCNDRIPAGWVTAQAGCWSMLKGGIQVNVSCPADLYFAMVLIYYCTFESSTYFVFLCGSCEHMT